MTFNGSILDQTYNLTTMFSNGNQSALDNSARWLIEWNINMGEIGFIVFLYVLAAILFLTIRRRPEVKDSEALVYSGVMCSFLGVLGFIVSVTIQGSIYRMIEWAGLLPLIVITAISIYMNITNQNF